MRLPERMKGVHIVRGIGKDYCYAWRGGPRVNAKIGSKAFFAELEYARATPKPQRAENKTPPKEPNVTDRLRLDPDKHPGLTHLYRHYGFDGKVLYVGITRSALGRWGEHLRRGNRSSWIDEVAVITVDHYSTRAEAEDAEAAIVLAERPVFNRVVRIGRRKAA
jgi:hypothetical protein